MSISPEGNHVAFIGTHDGVRQVYLRALDSSEAKPMAGTEGAYCTPVFSPDGQWLAFYSTDARELKKLSVQGGPPVTVVKAGGLLGASWGSDETIIYADPGAHGLQTISSAGGVPKTITQVDSSKGETAHRWPVFLPGAKTFLFVIEKGSTADDAQIVAQRLDTGERWLVVDDGTFPQCVTAQHLVYVHRGTLLAVPCDVDRIKVKGTPVVVVKMFRTPLTQTRKRKARNIAATKKPELVFNVPNVCGICGTSIATACKYCRTCATTVRRENVIKASKLGRLETHKPQAQARRSETQRRQQAARKIWKSESLPDWFNEKFYRDQIQRRISKIQVRTIQIGLSVSEPYALRIRGGACIPHPRHWQKLAALANLN